MTRYLSKTGGTPKKCFPVYLPSYSNNPKKSTKKNTKTKDLHKSKLGCSCLCCVLFLLSSLLLLFPILTAVRGLPLLDRRGRWGGGGHAHMCHAFHKLTLFMHLSGSKVGGRGAGCFVRACSDSACLLFCFCSLLE